VGKLKNCKGVSIVRLTKADIVRHPLVSRIVARYAQESPADEGKSPDVR
jgi:phosphate starvation-inducible protein PhoH